MVIQKVEVIQHTGDSRSEGKRRAAVVEKLAEDMQWEGYCSYSPKQGDRDASTVGWEHITNAMINGKPPWTARALGCYRFTWCYV